MLIRDKEDLELAYELVACAEDLIKAGRVAKTNKLIELKRDIRAYHKKERTSWIIHDDGMDGYTALLLFPEKVKSYLQALNYFMDNYYCECRPSMYDCTGQAFTWSYKLVFRAGRWYCYHSVGFDV